MNKIIVSIVFAVILIVGINKITDIIFYVEKPKKSAYQIAGISTTASTQMSSESSDDVAMENLELEDWHNLWLENYTLKIFILHIL